MLANCLEFREGSELTNVGYFAQLQICLTNNLIAIKSLYEQGLDTQAKAIYRNSIELSDIALCVIWDRNYFKTHSSPSLDKKNNPFITPKNRTTSQLAEAVLKDIDKSWEKDASNVVRMYWNRVRHEQYSILSESAHGNYLHNVINSFKENQEGHFQPALGGGKWKNLEKPLSDLCLHQIALKRYFTWALKLQQNVDLFDNGNPLHKLIYFLDIVIADKFLIQLIKPQTTDS